MSFFSAHFSGHKAFFLLKCKLILSQIFHQADRYQFQCPAWLEFVSTFSFNFFFTFHPFGAAQNVPKLDVEVLALSFVDMKVLIVSDLVSLVKFYLFDSTLRVTMIMQK